MGVSGPPPKRNGERRRRNAPRANTVKLPPDGRPDPPPPWPFGDPDIPEPLDWAELWSQPQAVMWERMGLVKVVARYARLREQVMTPGSREAGMASFWAELSKMEERLGLTPLSMLRLQWEVAADDDADDEGAAAGPGSVTRIDALRERLQAKQTS